MRCNHVRSSGVLTTLLISLFSAVALGIAAPPSPENFPFQRQSFRVRLQPGFFKAGSDLFEDILRSTGLVDKQNVLRFKGDDGNTNILQYSQLKTSMAMNDDQLIATVTINITGAELFAKQIQGCSVLLAGPLSFGTLMQINPNGSIDVDVPQQLYHAEGLSVQLKNCGFAGMFAGADYVRSMLRDGLKEQLGKYINDQEFKMVSDAKVDDVLAKAHVFMNLPAKQSLTSRTISNLGIAIGVRGDLASAKHPTDGLRIVRTNSTYLSGLGLEWLLDSGVVSLSRNIYDKTYVVKVPKGGTGWPEWGAAPFKKTGQPVNFDAAIMLRGSYLKSLFSTLYQAGFFNLMIQDSLLDKNLVSINPENWNELFQITLPDGTRLTKGNYQDLRLLTQMSKPPEVAIKNSKSIDLTIPDMTMRIAVKAKGAGAFDVLQFRARFHIVTTPELDGTGQLRLTFNQQPIEEFHLISRTGVAKSITDADIQKRMNDAFSRILAQAKVEIPLLKKRKVTIPYIGIDGDASAGTEALAVYLKIK
jgi:hypothetical protein